jgi:hypothetical protein
MVTRDVALALEHIELLAWRDLLEAASPADRSALGLRSARIASGFAMAADGPESLLQNRVLGLGLRELLTESVLEESIAHYPDGKSFALNLCPFAELTGASAQLLRQGFATFFHHLKWVRDDAPVTAVVTTLEVVEIGRSRAHEWAALYAEIHDLSPAYATWSASAVGREGWTHHLALDQERPVAAAAMYVHDDLAWLGKMGTLEPDRKRGAQGALIAARVNAGLAAGVRTFAMETAPDWPDLPGGSLRNAARAGFRPAYARPSWVRGLAE